MGSLVHQIDNLSDARYGVNVHEIAPPGSVRGVGTNVVAIVADLPWGPVDVVTEITSDAELYDLFAPAPFGVLGTYPALRAFLNKRWPSLRKIVRISPAAGAAADFDFLDSSSDESVTVVARYPGAVGNQIKVMWTANALDATARDATVTIGTAYTATYKAVATIVSGALVVTDPGDKYVVFSKFAGATLVPVAIAATALAGGADGVAVAGEYLSAIELLASASVRFDVGFVAEAPSGLIDAINGGIKAFADTHKKGFWLLSTPPMQSATTAKTYRATYATDRALLPWPRVKTVNAFDANRGEITVEGNSFVASAVASVLPEKSPGGAPGAPYLRGITGLEQEATSLQLNDLVSNGVTPFFMSDALEGAILHNAVTTTLTPGLTKVFRRRMTDFLTRSTAVFFERFVGELLDLDLDNRALGPVTGPEMASVRQFYVDLVATNRIKAFFIDEFSANTAAGIKNGQWIIILRVTLLSAQEQIVLQAQIGEGVEITELAA